MCKISLIIPVFNTEKYLSECLDSVLSQTLKDIEVICVDDGSTDNSKQILKNYSDKDSRIIILSQDNKGTGAARNAGLQMVRGEFIAFMDSDDFYPSDDVLDELYNHAIENDVLICGGSWSELFLDGNINFTMEGNKFGYKFNVDQLVNYRDYQFDYGFQRFIYNADFFKKNNILFRDAKLYEDPPFFVNGMIKAERFYALSKVVYRYRCAYKEWKFNENQALEIMDGLKYNFDVAKKNDLNILYNLTLERLGDFLTAFKWIRSIKVMSTVLNLYINLDNNFLTQSTKIKYDEVIYNIIFDEKWWFKQQYENFKQQNEMLQNINNQLNDDINYFKQKNNESISIRSFEKPFNFSKIFKIFFFWPWYVYKIYRIRANNPIKKRDLFQFFRSYLFFPYYIYKIYESMLSEGK